METTLFAAGAAARHAASRPRPRRASEASTARSPGRGGHRRRCRSLNLRQMSWPICRFCGTVGSRPAGRVRRGPRRGARRRGGRRDDTWRSRLPRARAARPRAPPGVHPGASAGPTRSSGPPTTAPRFTEDQQTGGGGGGEADRRAPTTTMALDGGRRTAAAASRRPPRSGRSMAWTPNVVADLLHGERASPRRARRAIERPGHARDTGGRRVRRLGM